MEQEAGNGSDRGAQRSAARSLAQLKLGQERVAAESLALLMRLAQLLLLLRSPMLLLRSPALLMRLAQLLLTQTSRAPWR